MLESLESLFLLAVLMEKRGCKAGDEYAAAWLCFTGERDVKIADLGLEIR